MSDEPVEPVEPVAAVGAPAEELPAAPPWLRAYLALLGTLALLIIYVIEAGAIPCAALALGVEGVTLPEAPPGAWAYIVAEVTLILVIVGAERLLARMAATASKVGIPGKGP